MDDDVQRSPYVQAGSLAYQQIAAQPTLFEDPDFPPVARSIEGAAKRNNKCRCGKEPLLTQVKTKNSPNFGKPYYCCPTRKCSFFRWALQNQQMQWYRFGVHNDHVLVSQ